jgi:hypothetical protein
MPKPITSGGCLQFVVLNELNEGSASQSAADAARESVGVLRLVRASLREVPASLRMTIWMMDAVASRRPTLNISRPHPSKLPETKGHEHEGRLGATGVCPADKPSSRWPRLSLSDPDLG